MLAVWPLPPAPAGARPHGPTLRLPLGLVGDRHTAIRARGRICRTMRWTGSAHWS